MIAAVNLTETPGVDVRVYLGRADIGVTEHFLYGSYVGAALKHVRSEAMPQNVRRNPVRGDTGCRRPFADYLENPLSRERLAQTG